MFINEGLVGSGKEGLRSGVGKKRFWVEDFCKWKFFIFVLFLGGGCRLWIYGVEVVIVVIVNFFILNIVLG